MYNNFGPGHDGWDYYWGLGWTVAGEDVAAQYGVEQAFSFVSTASGPVTPCTQAPYDSMGCKG